MSKPGCMEMLCTSYQCVLDAKSLLLMEDGTRSGQYNWMPGNNSHMWGHTLQEATTGLMGTGQPQWTRIMSAVQFSYITQSLPSEFESDIKWPGLLSQVGDQGWCGVSWLQSAVSVFSDRLSISLGRKVTLSADTMLHCDHGRGRAGLGCMSGTVDTAWDMLRKHGTWDSNCSDTCEANTCHVYHSQPAYRVGRSNTGSHPHRQIFDFNKIKYYLKTVSFSQENG